MSFFEFIMVLVGLVGAIAISVLLTYLGHIIRNWPMVSNPFLFLLFAFWLILNVVGHISGIWAFRWVDLDVHFSVFVIIAPVIFFTLAVTTLIPANPQDEQPIDLDAVYFASSRSVFLLLALHEASALAADFLPGVVGAPPAGFMLTMVLIFLLGIGTKHKLTHMTLVVALLASQGLPALIELAR